MTVKSTYRNGLGNFHPNPNAPIKTARTAAVDGDFEERKNTGRCVVAIPTATEPIHHMGDASEPKHMTVLWLGKPEDNPDLDMDAVQEAVRAQAEQAGLLTGTVESQGQLGDEGAQVAFLRGDGLNEFREGLLADPVLREGVGSVEQFPEFQPHVTLGYSPEDAVPDEDLPEEVIFDRVAVWDGDEHTEYPLGPSASSEENTDGAEAEPGLVTGEEMGLNEDFIAAITEAMTSAITDDLPPMEGDNLLIDVFGHVPKLAVDDAETLATACTAADQIDQELPRVFTRRRLVKRARELGCQHVIPQSWLRQPAPVAPSATAGPIVTDSTSAKGTDVPDLFQLKTQLSTLPDTALRTAYMRGVREYTMTAPQSRPPLPRDMVAQARVNSLIRLAQGDLSARTDDQDLLP